ncbi:putative YccA/Bax inhibitor family protein [Isoptericola jiangsuensis]|uniref:Putative YccA/Bax inhibitor family protein n=1 Tax=Isoptericola jiangsuensis TaxID=548579 RepID=A0A2A9F102_9MICO|nr:Bax inhibitor-1/YccA family protein [Isoptericola jiangsuensis]PFG44180.1 putative YccA/Bax inhibitor family protein [Isoptericola jiangsuensis]
MSNPVFSNSDVFGEPRRDARGGTATASRPAQYGQYGQYGAQAADAASLQNMYEAPSATPADTQRLTYTDVIMKTAGQFALLVVMAAVSWSLVDTVPMLWVGGMIVGLVLGLVNAFKKNPSPVLITLYSIAQGAFLGGISAFYEAQSDGIVLQAVLATLSVFGAALALFSSGKVRVTPKFTRFLLIGMVGYLVFSLVNMILVWTGVLDGWGMRGGTLGIIIGLVAVVLASMSLIVDFDAIKRGVEGGAPAKYAWSAAFGLMVTLIWLYLELLRLIAILRGGE